MLDRDRFPLDLWNIRERRYDPADAGRTETMFALGNGYLGLRGNHPDAATSYEHGTFVNGLYETWPIRHAENAYGFARVGQAIVNLPDAKPIELEVAGERFSLESSQFSEYLRELDMRAGVMRRSLVWQTRSGARLQLELERMVSFVDRHLAAQRVRITGLSGCGSSLALSVTSGLVNHEADPATDDAGMTDPRRADRGDGRTLLPESHDFGGVLGLAYRTASSGLGVSVAMIHDAPGATIEAATRTDDETSEMLRFALADGETVTLTKFAAYHDGDAGALADLTERSLASVTEANARGFDSVLDEQRRWLDDFWSRADVEITGQPDAQQSVRWCIFQLAQAAARADGRGVSAKGVSGSGYSGHYFWDTEVYVLPFLSYAAPGAARGALQMRVDLLPAARKRAREMSESGALYPWRTIMGEEASAYYPAGTAQYHIDADICFAVAKYVRASGDTGFLAHGGIDIAVETARMWAGFGFWRDETFHIHGVTGPDEYTAVVNDNLYTNAMARFNLSYAADALAELALRDPAAHRAAIERLGVSPDEPKAWRRAAAGMYIGFNEDLGIHEQDDSFLTLRAWDFEHTPREKYPLLLNFHPLVIYRHQVLKQADTVLALFLLSDEFTAEEKRANFEYYDPITTGDSSLSSVVQTIIAAEVGYSDLAVEHFAEAWSVDLADSHSNAADGVHVASAGGVWSALVYGFGGLRDAGGELSFDPRLPADWPELRFSLTVNGQIARVTVRQDSLTVAVESDSSFGFVGGSETGPKPAEPLRILVRGDAFDIAAGSTLEVALSGQGPRMTGRPIRTA